MPELLTRPVDHPRAREVLGGGAPGKSDSAAMARGWAIAFNFGATVAASALIGWAIQKWLWPGGAPWVLLAFLGFGLISGFVQFVRAGLAANR